MNHISPGREWRQDLVPAQIRLPLLRLEERASASVPHLVSNFAHNFVANFVLTHSLTDSLIHSLARPVPSRAGPHFEISNPKSEIMRYRLPVPHSCF